MAFELDSNTTAVVEKLCKTFGVATNADCLRKIIALANVVSRYANEDGSINLVSDEDTVTILLAD